MQEYWNKTEKLDKKLATAYAAYFANEIPTVIVFETLLGWMGLVGSPKGLSQLILPHPTQEAVIQEVEGRYEFPINEDSSCLGDLPLRIKDYITGKKMDFPNKLDYNGATDFQIRVWRTTQEVPYGETRTYHWIAVKLKCNRGEQAIGQALSRNPLPIIIPCHRIVASNGKPGGFSGGIEMKKRLLRVEGVILK
jgi:methylated-DNA-[protein]-cysteine S-methyltransferase